MKILVAIESSKNDQNIVDQTLSWCPRAGYNIRLFIPDEEQLTPYYNAIDAANHEHYIDMKYSMVVMGEKPADYAKRLGFDLLVLVPDHLTEWKPDDGADGTVLHFASDIAKGRVKFNKDPNKQSIRFSNGARMVRL